MDRKRLLVLLVAGMIAASPLGSNSVVAQGTEPCKVIRGYLDAVQEICIFKFGEDREKSLSEAKKKLQDNLDGLKYSMAPKISELVERYTTTSVLGYDKMRKGDTKLVQKAQELRDEIKSLCSWD